MITGSRPGGVADSSAAIATAAMSNESHGMTPGSGAARGSREGSGSRGAGAHAAVVAWAAAAAPLQRRS